MNVGPPSRARSRAQERKGGRSGGDEGRGARRQFAPTDPYGRWFFLPRAALEGPPSILPTVCTITKKWREPAASAYGAAAPRSEGATGF